MTLDFVLQSFVVQLFTTKYYWFNFACSTMTWRMQAESRACSTCCYRKQSMVPLSYRRADAVSRAHAGNPTRPPPPDVCVGRFLAGCSNFASFFDNIVLSASLFKNLELHVEKSTEDHDVTVDFTSDHKVHKNVY